MKKFDVEKSLRNKKYNQFKPTQFDDECVATCYQKAFLNDKDKRDYFITWKKYDFSRYNYMNNRPELNEPAFEADTQLTVKYNNQTINIDFLHGWKPEDVEKFLAKLFATGWFESYDDEE